MQRIFENWGAVVTTQQKSSDGLTHCLYGQFDLILLERHMNFPDGIRILNGLRWADIETPVILMSSESDDDNHLIEAEFHNLICVMKKPISAPKLQEIIFRLGAPSLLTLKEKSKLNEILSIVEQQPMSLEV